MCGIFGVLLFEPSAQTRIEDLLIDGLKKLEYRGYDSAGVSILAKDQILTVRMKGKIENLQNEIEKIDFAEKESTNEVGIGHTRWATHGRASSENAHPHTTENVAVVHNGIIENFKEIRLEMQKKGRKFSSETDSEVIPHLISCFMEEENLSPLEATKKAIRKLEGAFAIVAIFKKYHGLMIATRKGSPLAIGFSDMGLFVGSDAYVLAEKSEKICYLEEGDVCLLKLHSEEPSVQIFDDLGQKVERPTQNCSNSGAVIGKGNFRHFMLKEIFEQPIILGEIISHLHDFDEKKLHQSGLKAPSDINIIGCGTSFFSGMVARYWFEKISGIRTQIDIASEFRYRSPILAEKGLSFFISQSGETADTFAALKFAAKMEQTTVVLVNVIESSMARMADFVLPILAGPEIGVASTKAFTAQLMNFAFLALEFGLQNGNLSKEKFQEAIDSLLEIPGRISVLLSREIEIKKIAKLISDSKTILYTGRGVSSAVAFEGALKLKELSYIHAEAIAAGELKHGPIALVDENVPVIAIAPRDAVFEKIASNLREIAARGGKIILFSDAKGVRELEDVIWESFVVPEFNGDFSPLIYSVPLQLLAYHVALFKGTDVDQPRNLAKSVTVE